MAQIKALIIGATGYIGGSVLVAFLKNHPEIHYSAIVRNPNDNAAVEKLGVRVIQGSNKDLDLIERTSSEHDIVVNFADADDLPLTQAILKGLKARAGKAAIKKPVYIHTSGTGVIMDGVVDGPPLGEFKDIKTYDDASVEDIRAIHPGQPHRKVDLAIFEAGEEGTVDTFIISPSTIYGTGRGPVRNISQQVNAIIRVAIKNKQVLIVGPGTNVWDNVHIDDQTDLYVLVLEEALAFKPASPWERFYFGSVAKHVWGDIARGLATRLHKRGLVDTADVKNVEFKDHPYFIAVATNSRSVANRSRALGWKPHGPSLEATLDEEIDLTVSQL